MIIIMMPFMIFDVYIIDGIFNRIFYRPYRKIHTMMEKKKSSVHNHNKNVLLLSCNVRFFFFINMYLEMCKQIIKKKKKEKKVVIDACVCV